MSQFWGKTEGSEFTLISVYNPPGSTFSFYKNIIDLMVSQSKGFLVCGGYLNIHLKPKLDILKLTGSNKTTGKKVKEFMKDMGLIDIWREIFIT